MANNPDSEAFHEIPSSKCYYLGDKFGAVNKSFLKVFVPFFFISGVAFTLVTEHTNLWSLLATALFNAAAKYWYITLAITGVAALALYIRQRKIQRRKLEQARIQARRRKLEELVGGD